MAEMEPAFAIQHDWPHLLALLEIVSRCRVDVGMCLTNPEERDTSIVLSLTFYRWAEGPHAEPYRGMSTSIQLAEVGALNNKLWNVIMTEISYFHTDR